MSQLKTHTHQILRLSKRINMKSDIVIFSFFNFQGFFLFAIRSIIEFFSVFIWSNLKITFPYVCVAWTFITFHNKFDEKKWNIYTILVKINTTTTAEIRSKTNDAIVKHICITFYIISVVLDVVCRLFFLFFLFCSE